MHARFTRSAKPGMGRHPLALALSLALAAGAPAVGAATIQVLTADDASSSSTCTLRQAIAAMDAGAIGSTSTCVNTGGSFGTSDTVSFSATVTSVTLADAANSELLITDKSLTIQGSGTGGVTISRVTGAMHPFRIFHDTGTFSEENLYLSGLKITGGATIAGNASGGAIYMQPQSYTNAHLTLTNCLVSGSSTAGANAVGGAIAGGGAAIAHSGTNVTLIGSTVSGNSTGGPSAGGGAIYASYLVSLMNSVVSGNSTAGISSSGGAIKAVGVRMNYTTVSHNSTAGDSSAGGGIAAESTPFAIGVFSGSSNVVSDNSTAGLQSPGGGIYAASSSGILTNEIISNNSTAGNDSSGGGIYIASYYGVNFNSSTISGNMVTGASSSGGGIWSRFGKGSIKELSESTVSGNSASVGGGISINVCSSIASRALNIYNSTIAFNTTSVAEGGGVSVGNGGCPAGEPNKPTSATVAVASSILSNNSSGSASTFDVVVQPGFLLTVDTSFDLIQHPSSGGGITFVNGNGSPPVISSDPLLSALADNGCSKMSGAPGAATCVPTQAIGCRSLAYNNGSNPLSDVYDERGAGFARVSGRASDIGAYEFSYTANGDDIFCNGFEGNQ